MEGAETEPVGGRSQIEDTLANSVVAQLLFLEVRFTGDAMDARGHPALDTCRSCYRVQSKAPEKPIHMYINSPGGQVTSGMAIYDTMQV